MITDFILGALLQVLGFIATPLLFFDDVVLDPRIASSTVAAVASYKGATGIAPLTSAAIIFGLASIVFTEFTLFTYKVIMWGIKKIPGIS